MQKAVFLDRDGVINSDVGHYYIHKPEDFEFNDGVIEALLLLQAVGYVFVVISNQGGIAHGHFTVQDVEKVHEKLIHLMDENGINIKDIYFCPHHDRYEKCLCRKPDSINIEKAIGRFNIDIDKSFMIGDSLRDIQAAEKAGLRGIKIDSNQSLMTIVDQML
ncbi:MAG: HAD family hydrolase [Salinivirgaceae bacterium]|jgi:D-glycero-D-manno-heptose 1,7-bisphosphate phosphatase|nr:HAD family hydrolase [Salinivirgaceae bacterium]